MLYQKKNIKKIKSEVCLCVCMWENDDRMFIERRVTASSESKERSQFVDVLFLFLCCFSNDNLRTFWVFVAVKLIIRGLSLKQWL